MGIVTVRNVSGRSRCAGSDLDLQVWLPNTLWRLTARGIGLIGEKVADATIRVASGSRFPVDLEVFLNDKSRPDVVALAALQNAVVQWSWDDETFSCYSQAKENAVAGLEGKERKAASMGFTTSGFRRSPGRWEQQSPRSLSSCSHHPNLPFCPASRDEGQRGA